MAGVGCGWFSYLILSITIGYYRYLFYNLSMPVGMKFQIFAVFLLLAIVGAVTFFDVSVSGHQLDAAVIASILLFGIPWALFSEKEKKATALHYQFSLGSAPRWGKVVAVLSVALLLYLFWFVL